LVLVSATSGCACRPLVPRGRRGRLSENDRVGDRGPMGRPRGRTACPRSPWVGRV